MKPYTSEINVLEKRFEPDPDLLIWRYMDFHKFISLLHFRKLHFTRADRFEDVFEKKMADVLLQDWPEDRRKSYEKIRKASRQEPAGTYISCWTNHDRESYAMWQIYAKENGVAVQTRVSRLEEALSNSEVRICKVHYLDLQGKDGMQDAPGFWDEREGVLRRNYYVCKPKAYEYEREVRALVLEEKEDPSINIPVEVAALIENIYISPFASLWFVDLVKDLVCGGYGLKDKNIYMSHIKLNKSSLRF